MRRWFRLGWAGLSLTALAVACSSGDKAPAGSGGGSGSGGTSSGQGGSGASGGSSATGGTSATGGSSATGGGSPTGGAGAGGSSATGGTGALAGEAGAAGDDGSGIGKECASSNQVAKLSQANLLFLIDKSGSMNCNPPEGDAALNARCAEFPEREDPSKPSKWEVASSALSDALDNLSGLSNVHAGLTVFPKDDACLVDADPVVELGKLDATQRQKMADVLDVVTPAGETPIAGATILSYQHLADAIRSGALLGNTFVVLLTDGAETCKQSELPKLLATDVPHARLFDIRTFVIGAPGSESARSLLSQIAYEGGTASSPTCNHSDSDPTQGDCHFDMTKSTDFAKDLADALTAISRTKVLACEFDLPTNPDGEGVDRSKVNVTFKPGGGKTETIKLDDTKSCDEADGWQYSADGTKIELCGEVCDRVQADPEGEVRIALGCPTIKVVK